MRLPKLLVLAVVYGMYAIGLVMLWKDRRHSSSASSQAGALRDNVTEDGGVPAFK
jgi:hypothetical protein